MHRFARTIERLLREEGGFSRIWTSLAIAIALGAGITAYHQQGTQQAGACEFPTCFPDASNTGVPAGTSLTAYAGPSTITADDTVIDSKLITDCPLVIEAANVTITNSRLSCTASGGIYVDDQGSYARSNNATTAVVTLTDSEIDCGGDFSTGSHGIAEANITLIRVEIINCENGGDLNQNVTIVDSFIHELDSIGSDPHDDGFQCAGRWNGSSFDQGSLNLTFTHNTIYGLGQGDASMSTSAIICGLSGETNILIEQNLFAGGTWTVYCVGDSQTPSTGDNFQVIDNHFTTEFSQAINGNDNVGAFGPSDGCADETISGNVYHETGLPIDLF